jgi:hypothetical protein
MNDAVEAIHTLSPSIERLRSDKFTVLSLIYVYCRVVIVFKKMPNKFCCGRICSFYMIFVVAAAVVVVVFPSVRNKTTTAVSPRHSSTLE